MPKFLLSTFYVLRSGRRGLSLIELLVFAGIFSIVMIGFITVMVAVIRVQSRQSAAAEVNQQSQFLLQQFQYYIERSSLVDVPQDVSTSTLALRMGSASEDPTVIRLSGGVVYIKRGGAPEEQLTSSRVTVSNLAFTKRSNPPGKDSVNIIFAMEYNTQNLARRFTQALQTSVARVSAATFDSDVYPSSTATYKLGTGAKSWTTVNDVINFSGTNVGIGVTPNAKLQVSGGDIYIDDTNYGLVLRDSLGKCWRIRPSIVGALIAATTTAYGCPP